nr:MAG TPA: neuropilin glycoprotein-like protein [Caudoviricetes sp.]
MIGLMIGFTNALTSFVCCRHGRRTKKTDMIQKCIDYKLWPCYNSGVVDNK